MNLDQQYWDQRWQQQQTGWDLGIASPAICQYVDSIEDKNLRILIPGCGNAYEAEYLLQQGFTAITLIDISPTACRALEQRFEQAIREGRLHVLCTNFFAHSGTYDLIIEQTFFCALDPSLRTEYAKKMSSLLKPGGKLVGLLFNKDFEGGPPFGGSENEYIAYFQPVFSLVSMHPCALSVSPRQGTELWIELVL